MAPLYDPCNRPAQLTRAELLELGQQRQALRLIWITIGDCYLELGRAWILNTGFHGRPNLKHVGKSCGLIMMACAFFVKAGLSRRSVSAWRYARLLHRAQSCEAGVR